jgi:hypothetical protein
MAKEKGKRKKEKKGALIFMAWADLIDESA